MPTHRLLPFLQAARFDRRMPSGRRARGVALCSGLLCSCMATGGNPLAMHPDAARPAAEGVARVSSPLSELSLTSVSLPWRSDGPIRPVLHEAAAGDAEDVRHADVVFTPSEPRMPLDNALHTAPMCPPGCCPPLGQVVQAGAVTPRPDEFLCDGGDRGLPVHYGKQGFEGVETEDTVAEYGNAAGTHITPSNKVCVYAPRFGEVRSVTGSADGVGVEMLIAANDVRHGAGIDSRVGVDAEVQRTTLNAVRVRTRASGVETDAALAGVGQSVAAELNLGDVPPIVNTAFLSRGTLTRGESAQLAKAVQAAVLWTRTQNPVIAARNVSAQEVHAEFRAAALVADEDMSTPGKLRILKLADRGAAQVGDVITFTIRYDNLGDQPVIDVRIIDNLTPRLELVEGSGTSDRPGRLDVENNGEGSLVLTFVVADPVPGHAGGVVTFKARVR